MVASLLTGAVLAVTYMIRQKDSQKFKEKKNLRIHRADGSSVAPQVDAINGRPPVIPTRSTSVYMPIARPAYNVSRLDYNNGTLPEGQQITM